MNAQDIFGNKVVQAASIGVVSFAAGGVLGYVLGRRSKAEEVEEPQQMSIDFTDVELGDDGRAYFDASDVVEGFSEAEIAPTIELPDEEPEEETEGELEDTGSPIEWIGPDPRLQPPAEEVYISNVFDDTGDGEWDEELELSKRSADAPYIIKVDEFISNDTGFSQTTLTYYSKDEVVADERNVPVYDHNKFLGDNLKFGHGSRNADVVYIRNVQRQAEFEVIRFDGSHQEEMLGIYEEKAIENELRHSADTRRFRADE